MKKEKLNFINTYPLGLGVTLIVDDNCIATNNMTQEDSIVPYISFSNYKEKPSNEEEVQEFETVNEIGIPIYTLEGLDVLQNAVNNSFLRLLENNEILSTKEGFKKAMDDLENKHDAFKTEISNLYAHVNARFYIGDFISHEDRIIQITKIGFNRHSMRPVIYYHGNEMTKKLLPRKDSSTFTFFDDQDIKLIKKAEK